MNSLVHILLPLILCTCVPALVRGQATAEPFHFTVGGDTLRGLIERPANDTSTAAIVLIPGYGPTDFVNGGWFAELRNELVASGLTVCFWDKPGCGNSTGTFDAQQPVEASAEEAVVAIAALRRTLPDLEKLGMWGISRAGWIVPLINRRVPTDFWISVSGTDDSENFGYLLRSNLLIAGKSPVEADRLHQAWRAGHRVLATGGSYEAYREATRPLARDSFCRAAFGYSEEVALTEAGRARYHAQQLAYTRRGHFDERSGLWIYLPDFDELLRGVDCPVLALFGREDSQVDWRKTERLYARTIGENPRAGLTVRVFEQCNHSLQQCITCAYDEDLSELGWRACDGYYRVMKNWLREWNIAPR
jgi:pimeloyl-ACP methyl ester carboxylesterase